MKIVKLKGGLGNQMFQYAFAKYIEDICGERVLLDFSTYAGRRNDEVRKPRILEYNISLDKARNIEIREKCIFTHCGDMFRKSYKFWIIMEAVTNRKYCFRKVSRILNLEELKKYEYFDGYWQSWKYVEHVSETLLKEFTPKKLLSDKTASYIDKVNKQESVFVGIRRGDYLESPKNIKKYGIFTENYYTNAMKIISEKKDNAVFWIFSNDIEWVNANMDFSRYNVKLIKDENVSDFEEMQIMKACKHAIICNSTYYWWGAWLIENKDKIVVAPQNWFADGQKIDIIPDGWIKI
jgi:hypothetical protein